MIGVFEDTDTLDIDDNVTECLDNDKKTDINPEGNTSTNKAMGGKAQKMRAIENHRRKIELEAYLKSLDFEEDLVSDSDKSSDD